MSSCLDAADVPHWVFDAEMININPFHEIAYDGYKITVCDDDLQSALNVIAEARANPFSQGEKLSICDLTIVSLLLFFVLPGVIAPLKLRRWHDECDGRD